MFKAKYKGDCYYCTPCKDKIKVGDLVVPHPAVKGKYVHAHHMAHEKKESPQIPLFRK